MSRRFTFAPISPGEFMAKINALNWSRDAFCARTGYNETTVAKWMREDLPIPPIVPIFLAAVTHPPALMEAKRERDRLRLEDRENPGGRD